MDKKQNPLNKSDQPGISKSMSNQAYQSAMRQSDLADDKPPGSPPASSKNVNNTMNTSTQPSVAGETSESGDTPDPDSDDDALDAAHTMGIGLSEDPEHPQELDIAGDIDKAEEYEKTH